MKNSSKKSSPKVIDPLSQYVEIFDRLYVKKYIFDSIVQCFHLPTTGPDGISIRWESSDESAISTKKGCKTFAEKGTVEFLRGIFSLNDRTLTKEFLIEVPRLEFVEKRPDRFRNIRPLHRLAEKIAEQLGAMAKNNAHYPVAEKYTPILKGLANDQKFNEVLGMGGFGKIYREGYENKDYAIKAMHFFNLTDFSEEIAPFHYLGEHEKLIQYYGSFNKDGVWYAVLELADLDLSNLLNTTSLDKSSIVKLKSDIVEGIKFLHQKGVAHRDLKMGNIVIFNEPLRAKLIDFGSLLSDKQGVVHSVHTIGYIDRHEIEIIAMLSSIWKEVKFSNLPQDELLVMVRKKIDQINIWQRFINVQEKFEIMKKWLVETDMIEKTLNNGFPNGKWEELAVTFIKQYQHKMADIYALAKIMRSIDTSGNVECDYSKIEPSNPFQRSKIKDISIDPDSACIHGTYSK